MKKKVRFRQFLSGMMAVMTILSTTLSPLSVYAAEPEKKEIEFPAYEDVKEQLSEDEVVTAKDHEVKIGSEFEVEKDFTGLEISDEKKVKITLHEAKNEAGDDFSTDHEDTYKTVYYVEPVSGNPIYQIHRNIVVKAAETQTEGYPEVKQARKAAMTRKRKNPVKKMGSQSRRSRIQNFQSQKFRKQRCQKQNCRRRSRLLKQRHQ